MPAYIATINNQIYRVETDEEKQNITLAETTHTIDWRQIAQLVADAKGNVTFGGQYSLIIAGHSYNVFVRRITKADEKGSQTYEIFFGSQRFEVKVQDERVRLLADLVQSGAETKEAIMHAPMPGLVLGTPVAVGDSVTQGQTIIILEAMKMENDLSAPISGVIKELRVSKGQTVDHGEALAVITAE